MQKLRSIHLYLGCFFAPILMLFALSGIWQTFGIHSALLDRLSTIHTAHQLKNGTGLSGRFMVVFTALMALCFIATTILGVVMAMKHGRSRRLAALGLAAGIAVPLALVLLKASGLAG